MDGTETSTNLHDMSSPSPSLLETVSVSQGALGDGILLNVIPLPGWILHPQTYAFLAVNQAAVAHYGYTEAEFLAMTIRDVCVPDDMAAFVEQLSYSAFLPTSRDALRHRKKDGAVIYMEPARQEIEFCGSRAVLTLLNDVTERIEADEALRANQELLRTTLRSIGDAVITTDTQARVTMMNAVAERLTGWTEAEAKGRSIGQVFRIVNETTRSVVGNPLQRVLSEQITVGLANHTVLLSRGGTEYYIDDRGAPIQDQNGALYGAALVFRDITEGRRQERALEESAARTRRIVQTSLDAVVEIDSASCIIGWNQQAETIFGWTHEEAIGKRVTDTIIPVRYRESHNQGMEHFARTGEGPALNRRFEISACRRNGEEFAVEFAITPIQTAQGTTFSAFIRDISERKQAEDRLRSSELQLRAILDIMPSVVYLKDLQGRYLLVNRAFELLSGCSLTEAQGKTDFEIFPHELCEAIVADDRHVLQTGQPLQIEERGPYVNRAFTFLSTRFPLRDADGHIYALCCISTDITESKQEALTQRFLTEAAEVLASSLDYEQTLQRVADLAVPHIADWCGVDMVEEDDTIRQLAVAHIDPEKVKWGHELRRLYPPDPNEAQGLSNVLRTGQPEIYPDIPDALLVASARDARHLELIRVLGPRSVMMVPILARERVLGAITFVTTHESGKNYTDDDLLVAQGLATRAALAIENARLYRAAQEELAQRRQLQEELEWSEARFRFALANSGITVYMQDRDLRYTWVYSGEANGELARICGKTDDEFLESEDAARLAEIKRRVLQSGVEERHIARATYRGREPGYYDTLFAPLRDGDGNVVGVTGTVTDVTERKKAQDALVQHQAEIEALNVRLQRSMSETHHRVKNNLQVVSALLDMQEMQHEEVVPISEIVRLRQHVRSLSTIHDLLTFQAKKDAEVYDLSVKTAIENLVPMLQAMVAGRTIAVSVEDLRMPVRQSTTLTVLVNELVSNALKHGEGRIDLAFFTRNGNAVLEVHDEGPGFPETFDPVTWDNTGLELVQTLARLDLQGKTRFENRRGGGAWAVVEFPIPSTSRTAGEQ